MLPKEDGISILKKFRADIATCDIPVIMASAKGTASERKHPLIKEAFVPPVFSL